MRTFLTEKFSDITKKQAIFGILYIFWSYAAWILAFFIVAKPIDSSFVYSLFIFAAIMWFLLSALSLFFLPRKFAYLLYIFLLVLLTILFGLHDFNIIGVFLAALFFWIAHVRADKAREFLADFRTLFIGRKSLPYFFTALAIFSAFVYNSFFIKAYYNNGLSIPSSVYHAAFVPVETLLDVSIPGYEKGMSVREFEDIILDNFLSRIFPQDLTQPDPDARGPGFFERDISSLSLEEFTLTWIDSTLKSTLQPYSEFLPLFFIIGLFFAFKILFWPFMWITLGLSMLVIKVLLLYNILTVKEVTIQKNVPILE